MITVITVILFLFTFLFSLHLLVREDYVLFRKNVSQETVFNIAFILLGIALFSSRLFFVIFHFKKGYLNPLVFFHIINFPGLSLIGAVTGALLFFIIYFQHSKKIPFLRLTDLYLLSFLCSLPFTFIPALFSQNSLFLFMLNVIFILFYIFFAIIIVRLFLRWKGNDGTIGLIVLSVFCLISFLDHIVFDKNKLLFFLSGDELLLIFLFLFSILFLLQQKFIKK